MKRILVIVSSLLVVAGCATKSKLHDYSVNISDRYLNADSVNIRITYTLVPSCIERYRSDLIILSSNHESRVYHYPYEGERERIEGISGSVMDEIREFEIQAKKTKICGGYLGGNGIGVKMVINSDTTEFGYCQDEWDGINELLESLKKNKKTTANNG